MNVLINGRFHTHQAYSFTCKCLILSKKLDGLPEGSMSPKEAVGCLCRTACDEIPLCTISGPQAEGGRGLPAERKEGKCQRDLCRSPKKHKKHENNQILACCRTALFPYKYILLYFSFLVLPCQAVVTLLFQKLICHLDPFLM